MEKSIEDPGQCPLTAALRLVGGKWKPVIILNLRKSPKRFGQLDSLIPKISRKVLTSHLMELERDHLVIRKSYPEIPPRVEYELTDKAKELVPIFRAIGEWGKFLLEPDSETVSS